MSRLSYSRLMPVALVGAIALLAGCPADKTPEASGSASASPLTASADATGAAAAATGKTDYLHANELGLVPVMEYHRFGPTEERWTRTPANFRKDLEYFWANGYYLVNARDVANRKLDIPAGKKPVVFTFDDSTEHQFRYLTDAKGKIQRDASGKPTIDPDSALGMLDAFYAKHPDFGRAGTFYVMPSGFEQDAAIKEKFLYLKETNREIGNHTWAHDNMGGMNVSQVVSAIGKLQGFIHDTVGADYEVETLALPFGIGPRDAAAFAAVSQGGSGKTAYHFKQLLLVGANPNASPYDKAYKATAVARIQGIDSEFRNWFNRKPGSTAVAKEPWYPYVSDGDPTKVSFPVAVAKKLNSAALGAGVTANPVDPKAQQAAKPASPAPVSPSPAPSAAPSADATSGSSTPPLPVAAGQAPSAAPTTKVADDFHPGYNAKLPPGGHYKDGKLTYTVKSGDSVEAIAWKFVRYTEHYTYPKLASAIRAANGGDKALTIGATLAIPGVRSKPPEAHLVPVDKSFEAKGIYVTGTIAGSDGVWALVKDLKAHGGNTVVFDAKDMNGKITYRSQVPLAKEIGAYDGDMIQDMPKFLEHMHQEGIHTAARVALFHDSRLAKHKPQYALKSKRSGAPWREVGDLSWVDPSLPAVQDYNLALCKEMIAYGVDEIQFDYVRFPAQGDTPDIAWSTMKTQKAKHDVITAWVKRASEEIRPTHALLSADVYGVVAWDQGIDVRITGQMLEELGPHLDAISPMLYPSHFYSDFDHFAYPPDHPEYFVGEGVKKVAKKTAGSGVTIRPWLQAFPYRIHNYGPHYVTVQLKANQAAKGNGWLLWNAENNYKVGFAGVAEFSKQSQNQTATKP